METTSQIPRTLTAGDTVTWTEIVPEYPAATYALSMVLIAAAADSKVSFTATGSGDSHEFTIDAVASAALATGRYDYQLIATGDGYRITLDRGAIEVLADLSSATTYDGRDWLDTAIAALQASIAGRASKVQMERSFDGVMVKEMTPIEQLELLDKLHARRRLRDLKKAKGKGKALSRIIGVSF